jgi:hypothetical protein
MIPLAAHIVLGEIITAQKQYQMRNDYKFFHTKRLKKATIKSDIILLLPTTSFILEVYNVTSLCFGIEQYTILLLSQCTLL